MTYSDFCPHTRLPLAAWLCVAIVSASSDVYGQAPPAEKGAAANATRQFRVYPLKYTSAQSAEVMIQELWDHPHDVKMVVDDQNRLWVTATPEQLTTLEQLLEVLDSPAPSREPAHEVRIFALQNSKAAAAATLLSQLQNLPDVAIAVDERTNSLIVNAALEQLDIVEAILQRLDQTEPDRAGDSTSTYQIDLFWLVEALDENADTAARRTLDPRLKEAVDELTRQGFQGLQQWGQARVSAKSGAQFTVSSTSTSGWLGASGFLAGESGDHVELRLELEVSHVQKGENTNARADISTEIVTQPGHNVVLGIAGATGDDRRSAFVIRVERQ